MGVGAELSNYQLGGLHGEVAWAFIDVEHRADEMHSDLLGGSGAEDVSPGLLAFLLRSRSGALIDRDDELGDGAQDLEELGFCRFDPSLWI